MIAFRVDDIDDVALTVLDRERSATWYRDNLGLERRFEEVWGDEPLMMCAGTTCVALFRRRPQPSSARAQNDHHASPRVPARP